MPEQSATGFRKGFLLAAEGNNSDVNGREVKGVLILALGTASIKGKKNKDTREAEKNGEGQRS